MKYHLKALAALFYCCLAANANFAAGAAASTGLAARITAVERDRIFTNAEAALALEPITITRYRAKLSEGGRNDFYSNGDYWWPNPNTANGLPYVQRDGQTNPENFVEHRLCLMRLSEALAALGAAYKLEGQDRYVQKAATLLQVFFVDAETRMNPSLKYAQAIPGVTPGRGIGIIDTLHLIEVPLAVGVMQKSKALPPAVLAGVKDWFRSYVEWLTTSKNGKDEANAGNNHSVAYWLQIACFSRLTGDASKLAECRQRFKGVFVAKQMAEDGSFPAELRRTKPYGYSIFQLDNLASLCQIASSPDDDLWQFQLPDGRGMRKAMEFLYPFLADKSKWPRKPDVQAWAGWPVRQPSLLFGGLALNEPRYLELWQKLPAVAADPEVRRNVAITQPVLWLNVPEPSTNTSAQTDTNNGEPRVFLLNGKDLAANRQRISAGDADLKPALEALLKEATGLLKAKTVSVMDKETIPPSGDKHDYMSQAPYFWPNPQSSNGLPYIRRDGEHNPEIGRISDHANILAMPEKAQTLALAWYFSGDGRYAEKAASFLRVWFLDPDTRMNPNFLYAQAVPGMNTGRGIGLIESRGLTRVVDAVGLLAKAGAWTAADQRGLESWFREFLQWMVASPPGREEAAARNNHGTYYDLQAASFALFVGDRSLAIEVLSKVPGKRIAVQIEPDGRQPLELARTRAWSYSTANLSGLMSLAKLGECVNIDLWHYQTADGRSIRRALDYLAPFALGKQTWPHPQLGGWSSQGFAPLARQAARHFPEAAYQELLTSLPPLESSDRSLLLQAQIGTKTVTEAKKQ